MIIRASKATLLAGTIITGSLLASPAMAQEPGSQDAAILAEPEAESQQIIVTGSRIQRRNTDTAAPVAVVTDEEFQLSGSVNVESVVNTLPQVVPGFTSTNNNPGTGTATLNLRGLGEERTLVLVNGRRWMFYDTAQIVDLNTIPSFLIDSVDVVTGGASAVYGSDALAGVVNFRLRDVQGLELGGQLEATQEADGFAYELHGAIGSEFADGRGNVTVFGEYFKRESIFQSDRAFSNFALGGETTGDPLQQFGSSTVPQGRINTPGTVTVSNPVDLNGDGDTTDEGEALVSAPLASGLTIDDAIFDQPGVGRARTGDLYNFAPANYLQVPQERFLLGGYADYEWIDGGHEVYAEFTYVNNRVATELAATPVTGTFNVDLDTVQPFLSEGTFNEFQTLDQREAAAQALIDANNAALGYCGPGQEAPEGAPACAAGLSAPQLGVVSTFIQRRILETGSRNSLDERNAFRVMGGLRGPIGDYLDYDGYYLFARTRNANIQAGNISASAFQAGLDGTGTPINIFGPNTLSTGQVGAISILAQNGDISSVEVMSGSVTGTFADFALGESEPIGFALGVEHRRVASEFIPDTALASGDVIGFNAGQPTEGSYDVREVFGELNVPIEFGTVRVELNGAGRYSDYSLDNVGGVWTYAGGVEVSPVRDITLRGQFQRAIRAPNVTELFGGRAIGFPVAVDPCASEAAASAGTLQALCLATGVPAGTVGTEDVQINTQIPAIFGGNPDLQEETSDSWTAGVVLQPSFLPGLTITADYFNIKIEDAISDFGGGLNNALRLCYNVVQDISDPLCQVFLGTRDVSTGAITTANPPLIVSSNIATLETSGVDVEASYLLDLPFALLDGSGESALNLGFLGTWTEKANFAPVQGGDITNECAGLFGTTCSDTSNFGNPIPEFKWTARGTWIDGPLTTSVRWRHLSAVDDDNEDVDFTAFNGIETIDAYDLIDLTFAVDLFEQYTVTLGVNNLFNTLPGTPRFDENGIVTNRPNSLLLGDNQEQSNTYPGTYDVIGRRFFLSFDARF